MVLSLPPTEEVFIVPQKTRAKNVFWLRAPAKKNKTEKGYGSELKRVRIVGKGETMSERIGQRLVRFMLICLGILLSAGISTGWAYTIMGNIGSYTEDGNGITFNCANGRVRLSFLESDLVRVHMSPSGVFPPDDLHLDQNGPYAAVTYT
jgi:hypothetical protein